MNDDQYITDKTIQYPIKKGIYIGNNNRKVWMTGNGFNLNGTPNGGINLIYKSKNYKDALRFIRLYVRSHQNG